MERFERGEIDIAALQLDLEGAMSALERDQLDLINQLRVLDADLEEIRFGMLFDEQRPAAIFRIDPVKALVNAALGDV